MKTFAELKTQLLNEHHERYVAFTRLLVTLSIAFITLLASSSASANMPASWLFRGAVACQLFSLVFGLIVQHQIMIEPIHHLEDAERKLPSSREDWDGKAIELRRPPRSTHQYAYKLQMAFFVLSFLLVSGYLVSP